MTIAIICLLSAAVLFLLARGWTKHLERLDLANQVTESEMENVSLRESVTNANSSTVIWREKHEALEVQVEEGEWGLQTLIGKFIAEYDDAVTTKNALEFVMQDAMNQAAVERLEDLGPRIKFLSNRTAILFGLAELLDVRPEATQDALIEKVQIINVLHEEHHKASAAIASMRAWLGAKKGESLRAAIMRTILTAEVAPGAARELQTLRGKLGIPPGQTILEALTEPMSFNVVINKTPTGTVLGATLTSERQWPKIGDLSMTVREIG